LRVRNLKTKLRQKGAASKKRGGHRGNKEGKKWGVKDGPASRKNLLKGVFQKLGGGRKEEDNENWAA